MIAPLDVQLDRDDRTMVQPDVLVVCDRSKWCGGCVYGAPDFVMEILSPSTWEKDMYVKLGKYESAGVREYWIVIRRRNGVLVYDLSTRIFRRCIHLRIRYRWGFLTESAGWTLHQSMNMSASFMRERTLKEEDDEREKREDED